MVTSKITIKKENTDLKKVFVYSTPTCPWCNIAKEYLKEKKVNYTEKNVAIDMKAREEMVQKTGQLGVPVIDINGNMVIGFDKMKIDQLLRA